MMPKCIIVKIGGNKKRELSKKRKFGGYRGKRINLAEIGVIYKFCGNMREICNTHHWLRGMNALVIRKCTIIFSLSIKYLFICSFIQSSLKIGYQQTALYIYTYIHIYT